MKNQTNVFLVLSTLLLSFSLLSLFAPSQMHHASAVAHAVPTGFEDTLVFKTGSPTGLAWTPDGRMLISRKGGQLMVYEKERLLQTPAIDLNGRLCTNGERGLGDVAVHPNFAENGYIFLYFTYNKFGTCDEGSDTTPVNRLSRFVLGENNLIDPNSETIFFDTAQLNTDHHNGGDIAFGKDGHLYVTVGDGDNQVLGWHEDPGYLVGKIIRLTEDGGIPSDNPYTGADSVRCNVDGFAPAGSPADAKCQEVFSMGFRNPFRFAHDPNSESVRFFINDVGSNTWEEISEGPIPGGHYGWNDREGPCRRGSETECVPPEGLVDPVHWYPHNGAGAATTGGAFVPNGLWPQEYDNSYLFGRFVQGRIVRISPGGDGCRGCLPPTSNFIETPFIDTPEITTMLFGPYQETQALYYTTQLSEIRRIVYVGEANRSPVALAIAEPNAGPVPLDVQFDASSSTDPDADQLTYEWDLDGDGTVDATIPAPTRRYTEVGVVTVTLTVRDGNGGADSTSIIIDAGNTPPVPLMDVPALAATFAAGEAIILTGRATDQQDGDLPGSALTWEVRQHHNVHWHPFLDPTTGNRLEIVAPGPEDLLAATNSYLEVILTATDSNGLSTTISRDVMPRKVLLTFLSEPEQRSVVVEDTTFVAPTELISWERYELRVNAPDHEDSSGNGWLWQSWSNGREQTHTITVPAGPQTYTAKFQAAQPATATPANSPTATNTPILIMTSTATSMPTPTATSTPTSLATPTIPPPQGQSQIQIYLPVVPNTREDQ